jgi:hypothetical protein
MKTKLIGVRTVDGQFFEVRDRDNDTWRINNPSPPLERMFLNPPFMVAVVTPDPAKDPRMQHLYVEPLPRDWFRSVCELIDSYGIKVLYTVKDCPLIYELRDYCVRKGVALCLE